MRGSRELFVHILLLVLCTAFKDVNSQAIENSRNFLSPFDAWRRNFPPSSSGSSFWPSFHNYEPRFRDTELDSFSAEDRTENGGDSGSRDPFEVDVISSNVPTVHESDPSFLFHQSIPFFENHPFLFGNFGLLKRKEPWWRGPNVCTDRQEDLEEEEDSEEGGNSDAEIIAKPAQSFFSGIQFSVNSCVEKTHKHICKQVLSQNGRKKTLTVTHQCCHGYGRPRNAELTVPCDKIELKTLIETADELGAQEFVNSAKNNGLEEKLSSNITLFLPTNHAFTEFSEQMLENNLVVMPLARRRRSPGDPSGITNKGLAMNHMVDGWINIEDVKNEQLLTTNYQNSTIRMNLFPRLPNHPRDDYPYLYTANCAPLVKVNKMTSNGIIHVVDRVLMPVTKNVMEIIRERSDMAVLRTILEKTNLSATLEGEKAYTILAPTDKAFEKLDMHLRRTLKEGKGCAINILKNHILDLTFCTAAVASQYRTSAYNLMGQQVNFERVRGDSEDKSQAVEVADLAGNQDIIVNGQAKMVEYDIMGTNGVVHVVDTIMPTDAALPVTSLLEKKNLTIFKQLIEKSDLEDYFDDLDNVTFFAPTDKAFEGSYWKQKLEENPDDLKGNPELKEFLNYHVVQPMTKTCDLSEKMVDTKAGMELRVNLYSTHALFSNVMNRATVNCARLIHFDDESCGSVLHQVDKVLTPPTNSLLQSLEMNKDYSMFLKLVRNANLIDLLDNSTESFTILVPKNDVFLEVEDWYQSVAENQTELEYFIKSHIVNDVVCCAGIIPTNWPFVRTIETINKNQLRISRDRRPKIENAGVTKCDIIATNGILHEINDVINVKKRSSNPDRHHFQTVDDFLFK